VDREITLAIFFTVTISCLTIIMIASLIIRTVNRRKSGRQEFEELRRDVSQIKSHVEEIREQLANIIDRLG
jgi:hypothetical protein